jgi:ArsR family transcriptional regulator
MLLLSLHDELCVCDLMLALNLSQPKISRHLAQLREFTVLTAQRRGQWVFYRLNADLPVWMIEVLKVTAHNSAEELADNMSCLSGNPDQNNRC